MVPDGTTRWYWSAGQQKEVMLLDKKGVRNGDQSHLMQPNSLY